MLQVLSEAATVAAQAPRVEAWYFEILFGLGLLILLVAWLPMVISRMALSLPIVCVAIGIAIFSLTPLSVWAPHPVDAPTLVERSAELLSVADRGQERVAASGPIRREW